MTTGVFVFEQLIMGQGTEFGDGLDSRGTLAKEFWSQSNTLWCVILLFIFPPPTYVLYIISESMNFWKDPLSLLGRSLSTILVFNEVIMIMGFSALDILWSITYLTLEMTVAILAVVQSEGDVSG